MRKITEKATNAIKKGKHFKLSNTRVELVDNEWRMYLFNNLIAKRVFNDIYITTAGYNTRTTLERLCAIVPIRQRKGELFVMNKSWDGSWKNILEFENE